VVMFVVMCMSTKIAVSHDHQLNEKEDEDGHEDDALGPVVLGDGPCQARIGEGIHGWRQKLILPSASSSKRT
jgi:hypothetical protein